MKKSAFLITIVLSLLIGVTYAVDCHFDLIGDLNFDCKVTLEDVSMLSLRWMIDCNDFPIDPECFPLDLDEDGYDVIADCDDHDPNVSPGIAEVCSNSIDDDCDSFVDCDDSDCVGDPYCGSWWFYDSDGDGYGDASVFVWSAAPPAGYVANDNDCDDGNININPGAPEICDGLDNDCDPGTLDGADDPSVGMACDGPDTDLCAEGVNSCSGGTINCSDTTGNNVELCDGTDNDCNAATPDGADDPSVGLPCDGPDTDLCMEGTNSCIAGTISCDDTTGDNVETCDGLDNDCDGTPDNGLVGALCPLQLGVCSGSTQVCSGGMWMTCGSSNYGPNYEPVEATCGDTLDNDCDGSTDISDSNCSGGSPVCWDWPTQCYGDTDDDGDIDATDYATMTAAFGTTYPDVGYDPCSDFDRDGDVDITDDATLLGNWGIPPADCTPGGTWPP